MPIAPTLIDDEAPPNWRALQDRCATILNDCGLDAKTTETIDLVRGQAEIDVHATDKGQIPATLIFCECKRWKKSVPQSAVHAFRTVVADGGAHIGYLISSSGFQSGARNAAQKSNVRLVTWEEFQATYADRWFERLFFPAFRRLADPLAAMSDPTAGTPRGIPEDRAEQFWREFDKRFDGVGCLALATHSLQITAEQQGISLRRLFFEWAVEKERKRLPNDILARKSLSGWLVALLGHVDDGKAFARSLVST